MKFSWPPSEQKGWQIQTIKQKEKTFFLPLQKHSDLLLALRVLSKGQKNLEIPVGQQKSFTLQIQPEEWLMLPFPIEQHAIGPVWDSLVFDSENIQLELAYHPWASRVFRMRALLNEDEEMLFAYRINKNGQTILYFPFEGRELKLAEDAYLIPPTHLINEKSIHLVSLNTSIPTKKMSESRYFSL